MEDLNNQMPNQGPNQEPQVPKEPQQPQQPPPQPPPEPKAPPEPQTPQQPPQEPQAPKEPQISVPPPNNKEEQLYKSISGFISKFKNKSRSKAGKKEVSSLFKGADPNIKMDLKVKSLKNAGKPGPGFIRRKLESILKMKKAMAEGGFVGLDIGTECIKIAHVKRGPEADILTSYHIEPLPLKEIEAAKKMQALQEILRKLKKEGLFKRPVVCAFTDPELEVELLKLPRMPHAELAAAVEWAMKEQFTLDLDESVLDFAVVGATEEAGEKQVQVLAVTTKKKQILEYLYMLTDLGINVTAIEPAPLAFFESIAGAGLWKQGEVVGLLDIGAGITDFDIVVANSVTFTRTINIASRAFTQSIADYCVLEQDVAEDLKKTAGMSRMVLEEDRKVKLGEQDDRVKVAHALGLKLEQLLVELDRSFKYFSMELTGSSVSKFDRVLIGGGGGLLKNLCDFLSYRLQVPVEVVDPLKGLKIDEGISGNEDLKKIAPQLCVAIGLALRR